MKGLVIKDLMCLRKQFILFAYIVVSVLVISVMFVLSARFGNIFLANQEMMAENSLTDLDITNLSTTMLMLFMLLPIASVGDFASVFEADAKAGFAKVSSVMPLPVHQRVMAKYITILSMFGMGVIIDLVIAFVLSLLTDIISFADFFGIIISAASIMSIYSALVILLCFALGQGKEDYARLLSLLCMLAAAVLANLSKLKEIVAATADGNSDGGVDYLNDFLNFFKQRSYILFVLAVLVMVISYFASVFAAKRKRGAV